MDTTKENEVTVIGFHPISDTEKVEVIRTASGDYQFRLMVNGEQQGLTVGGYGPGLVGLTNAQVAAAQKARGIRADREWFAGR